MSSNETHLHESVYVLFVHNAERNLKEDGRKDFRGKVFFECEMHGVCTMVSTKEFVQNYVSYVLLLRESKSNLEKIEKKQFLFNKSKRMKFCYIKKNLYSFTGHGKIEVVESVGPFCMYLCMGFIHFRYFTFLFGKYSSTVALAYFFFFFFFRFTISR